MAIYKRPNSRYYWMKFVFDGELVQRSTQVKSKKDAVVVEAALRTQLALRKIGIEPPKDAPTFDKAVDDFIAWSKVEHALQKATYKRYYFSCQILKSYFGKKKAGRIEAKDIEKYIVWRTSQTSKKTGKTITRETVNHELLTIKMIFNRLIEGKFINNNPARTVKKLSENERNFHVLTYEAERRYLLACPQPLKDVAALMLETGMRCGEIYRIRKQEVDIDNGYLQVVKGKTKSSVRRIHLSEKAKDILRYRINKFSGENLFPQGDKDFNKPTESLDKQHRVTATKLGIKFRLYDCRHTFATRAVQNGIDLVTLAQILGHSSLRMVMRYAHPSEAHKAEAMKRMEQVKNDKRLKAA